MITVCAILNSAVLDAYYDHDIVYSPVIINIVILGSFDNDYGYDFDYDHGYCVVTIIIIVISTLLH